MGQLGRGRSWIDDADQLTLLVVDNKLDVLLTDVSGANNSNAQAPRRMPRSDDQRFGFFSNIFFPLS